MNRIAAISIALAALLIAAVAAVVLPSGSSAPAAAPIANEMVVRSGGAQIPATPRRIVSVNPCADALLMQLADANQIASVSHYSHDKRATSIPLEQAQLFPATSGTAEEILAMQPDLVVAGSHVARPTARALERLNIPLVKLMIPQSVAESQEQIATLAKIVGKPERGVQLNKNINAAFTRAKPVDDENIPALIWRSGGLVPGGGTLPDELLRRTGFKNVSDSYGLKQWDILPLEHLVARPSRILFSNGVQDKATEKAAVQESRQTDRTLSHPVLKKLAHRITIAHYPERLLHCAGPTLIEATMVLSAARRKLKGSP
ncbi:ABC transporter substrate-binding protein [Parasphingorhabdus sp. JC815]|uniref:ABC transporter substrate-binding protein n=1 Tax=Parasphingorhabdus sp. JC815 TaxID=3232140 RepID=UPI003458F624